MERAGWEMLDVENLRLHYARTCRHWAERLQARADEARAIVGERVYRTWLLYLTCSSVAFAGGSIGLYQVLMRSTATLRWVTLARVSPFTGTSAGAATAGSNKEHTWPVRF